MIFRRLLSRDSSAPWYLVIEGPALSVFAHAMLVGAWLASTRGTPLRTEPEESFSIAEYLIPHDRLVGSRPKQERISWTRLPDPTPGAGQAPEPLGDQAKLHYVKPKGEKQDEEIGERIPEPQPELLGDSIMTEIQVDSVAARYDDSAAPPYPPALLRRHIEGSVMVQYVVDTTGRADTASFRVLTTTHKEFAQSVRTTLPMMRFHSAIMGGRRVKQLVQQAFSFRILDSTMTARQRP
ncbi:MAG: energy transducer TonB [Gemmatimonadaceae bacterium]